MPLLLNTANIIEDIFFNCVNSPMTLLEKKPNVEITIMIIIAAFPLSFFWQCNHCLWFQIESHMSNEFDIKETRVLFFFLFFSADDSGSGVGVCGLLLTWISWLLVVVTLPFSLCVCFKVSLTYWNSIGNSPSPNLTYLTKRSNLPWMKILF